MKVINVYVCICRNPIIAFDMNNILSFILNYVYLQHISEANKIDVGTQSQVVEITEPNQSVKFISCNYTLLDLLLVIFIYVIHANEIP